MIYISELKEVKPDEKWKHNAKCIVIADTPEELIRFGSELGGEYHDEIPGYPYYFLEERSKAISKGAIEEAGTRMSTRMRLLMNLVMN
jgi:hypothetical protein